MSKEIITTQDTLNQERFVAKEKGVGFGWTNNDEMTRKIAKAVAEAATKAHLGQITITDINIDDPNGKPTGIKIVDAMNSNMSGFWNMVHDVQVQLRSKKGHFNERALRNAVSKTIKEKISGELDRKLETQDINTNRGRINSITPEFEFYRPDDLED